MFKFDFDSIANSMQFIGIAAHRLTTLPQMNLGIGAFTTSPALGSVAGQYAAYVGEHPGSLAIATKAVIGNIEFLHTSLDQLAQALECQERCAAESFETNGQSQLPNEYGTFSMPSRPTVPLVDLGYIPPVAAVEAGTPLDALTAMFAGSDGPVHAVADTWISAAKRITSAVDALQRASSTLEATTQGIAFDALGSAIDATVAQARVIASNATMMGTAMARLPAIRATAHTTLMSMQAQAATRKTAILAAGGANPAGVPAALAGAEAQSRAEVAAFVSSYLQPALDTARPMVANLGTELVGHHGGGVMTTGVGGVTTLGSSVTQVAGGVSTLGQMNGASQPVQAAQQVGQVANSPSGGVHVAPMGQGGRQAGGTLPVNSYPASVASGTSLGRSSTVPSSGAPGGGVRGGERGGGVGAPTSAGGGKILLGAGRSGGVVQPLLPQMLATSPGRGGTGALNSTGGTGGMSQSGSLTRGGNGSMSGAVGGPMAGGGVAGAGGRSQVTAASAPSASLTKRSALTKSTKDLVKAYFRRQLLGEEPKTAKTIIR